LRIKASSRAASRLADGGAAEHRAQPCLELGDVEGFEDIVVRAGIQACDALIDTVTSGENEDRQQRGRGVAQSAQHIHSVDIRQAKIEDHRIIAGCRDCGERICAEAQAIDGETMLAHVGCNHVAERFVIFDDEELH
jgi:hypothetical protein